MESILQNSVFVFWSAIALIVIVPAVTAAIAHYWYRVRRAEYDMHLKSRMLELGMSADDIKTVIEADLGSKGDSIVVGNAYFSDDRQAS